MQIGVEGLRQTVSVGCLAEHREVADGIRLVREGGPRDDPRCIVDGAHERQPGTAVAWWSPGADRRKPGLAKETADGPGRDAQVGLLLFLQPLRQVDRVETLVGRPGELQRRPRRPSSSRLHGRRPRLPWTSAVAPLARYRSTSRRICRTDRRKIRAASSSVSSPASTWLRTYRRCCARASKAIVSLVSMPTRVTKSLSP